MSMYKEFVQILSVLTCSMVCAAEAGPVLFLASRLLPLQNWRWSLAGWSGVDRVPPGEHTGLQTHHRTQSTLHLARVELLPAPCSTFILFPLWYDIWHSLYNIGCHMILVWQVNILPIIIHILIGEGARPRAREPPPDILTLFIQIVRWW